MRMGSGSLGTGPFRCLLEQRSSREGGCHGLLTTVSPAANLVPPGTARLVAGLSGSSRHPRSVHLCE
jgi:hypothetical protein